MSLYTYGVYRAGKLIFSSEPMSEADAEASAELMRLLQPDDVIDLNECEEDWVDFDHQD
jgi:SH3-like domain-containing protein